MSQFHSLTIQSIEKNTPSSVVITFDVPSSLRNDYKFIPGQYITIEKELNGETLRRSYSICADPTARKLAIAVKKIEGGTFSVYANETLKVGDTLNVHTPEGRFLYNHKNTGDTVIGFAAGSGITPIMSIIQSVIYQTNNTFVLVYGNKSLEETMFKDQLFDLVSKFPDRLKIRFVFSQKQEENSLYGRIESATVAEILKEKPEVDGYYVCGPEAMINTVSEALESLEIPKSKVHFELFTSSTSEVNLDEIPEGMTKVKVLVDDEAFEFDMDHKVTVLQAALLNGVDAPYSCQGGICSSCVAKVIKGTVTMEKNQILTDDELVDGLILTCQSHPTSNTLEIDYDDV